MQRYYELSYYTNKTTFFCSKCILKKEPASHEDDPQENKQKNRVVKMNML